jgi:hypothetical protein
MRGRRSAPLRCCRFGVRMVWGHRAMLLRRSGASRLGWSFDQHTWQPRRFGILGAEFRDILSLKCPRFDMLHE